MSDHVVALTGFFRHVSAEARGRFTQYRCVKTARFQPVPPNTMTCHQPPRAQPVRIDSSNKIGLLFMTITGEVLVIVFAHVADITSVGNSGKKLIYGVRDLGAHDP